MKYFIVNVNKCLPMSQYAPFFYEHIYNGDLVMLDDIENTCQLDKTYRQLVSHLNRNPFAYQKSVILLFIRRDFSHRLQAQDYELYNDIHIYTHLLQKLSSNFQVFTFYVDRTGEKQRNDAVYQQLHRVNHSLQAQSLPELKPYFLSLEQEESGSEGSFKDFLKERINCLSDCTRHFYLQMLEQVADMQGTPAAFQNGINNYIGVARSHLAKVNHISAPVYWLNIAEEIQEWFKIIYYIKEMITNKQVPMEYTKYTFDRYDEVRRLIATYRKRLTTWSNAASGISDRGTYVRWEFCKSGNAAVEYHEKVNLINQQIEKGTGKKGYDKERVGNILKLLRKSVTDAKGQLQDFGKKQSALLLDETNYQKIGQNTFDRTTVEREDQQREEEVLNKLNKPFGANTEMPGFSQENQLEQELNVCEKYIEQVFKNLKDYKIGSFIGALLLALAAVAGLYALAQYSIFIKSNSWWIYAAYLAVLGLCFGISYLTVRRKYQKEIDGQISECKTKVTRFLSGYKQMATAFEENTRAAGQYDCLKRELEDKQAERAAYQAQTQRYAWHKMKVEQLLRDIAFFDGFVGKASPYEESALVFDDFTHDPEHTEFYLMKVIRK